MTNIGEQIFEWLQLHSGSELGYGFLIVLLFIVPRLLLKFGIPMALTAFVLGLTVKIGFNFYDTDNVIPIFSTLGIISLFLFAGLEVDLIALRKTIRPIAGHIGFRILVVSVLAAVFSSLHSLTPATAIVLALALATPSTGFILDTLASSAMSDGQKFWIKLKAISAELVALGALLIISQMRSVASLVGSLLIIGIMVLVLPYLLKKLADTLEKLAPGSEFSFIMMLAIISGLITKKLGAYYLVGAFLVGMAAGQYKRQSPSASTDQVLQSMRSFSTFFMPFYFFNSGLKMPYDAFSLDALYVAAIFLLVSAPIKVGTIILHRRMSLVESWKDSLAIAVSLMPNLIFGLVLADILKNKMGLSVSIYGGLVIYTLFITMLSPLLLRFMPGGKNLELVTSSPEDIEFANHRAKLN
ncbi:MAG: cation:proton antiporter [Bdellovibrionales bacterium]|nr:cation:proton antiporter [Bdellovibrionales bacterium]